MAPAFLRISRWLSSSALALLTTVLLLQQPGLIAQVTDVKTGTGLTGGPITTTGTVSVANGGITSAQIATGTIVNANISGTAAISVSKIQGAATLGVNTFSAAQTITAGGLTIDNGNIALPATASSGNGLLTLGGIPFLQNFGSYNTFIGKSGNFSMSGGYNVAAGYDALMYNTTGNSNTAVGECALCENTSGSYNTAVGNGALVANLTGTQNTATGAGALNSNTGSSNTAYGVNALFHNTGSNNVALGVDAGENATTGNNNIYIANSGVAADNAKIRIGTASQTQTFIAGITGVTIANGLEVVVNSAGQLGTIASSGRYKEDIRDMGDVTQGLMSLRPVVFRYNEVAEDGSKPLQYGLIAEEVAKVDPGLVVYSGDGQPEGVKYQSVNAMLLNEVQQQNRQIQAQQEAIDALKIQLESLELRLRDKGR